MQGLSNQASLIYFMPEFVLTAGFLVVVLWDLFAKGAVRTTGLMTITAASLVGDAALCVGYLVRDVPAVHLFYGLLTFDAYSHVFRIVFAFASAAMLLMAAGSAETGAGTKHRVGVGEMLALLLALTLGMNLMVMSRNLLMIYLAIELVSLLSFVLAGYRSEDKRSSEAALKYVIFGGLASGVMLYGMSWLYGFSQSLDLGRIATMVASYGSHGGVVPLVVLVGVTCVLAGFGYKISVVPFHLWTPDVYEGAPTPVTALLSVGPKAAGFAVLVRFFVEGLGATSRVDGELTPWAVVLGLIAIVTMFVGNLSALQQDNVKRMLAFSSIAHAGTMLLGLCVFDASGVRAIVFYVIVYALMNMGAFWVVLAVAQRSEGDETLGAFAGLGSRSPVLAVSMTVFLFSLAGLPPFGGFVGKFYVFAALVQQGGSWNWVLAVAGVINAVISLFYYARVLRAMYLTRATRSEALVALRPWVAASMVLACATIWLGVYWGPVYEVVKRSVVWQ